MKYKKAGEDVASVMTGHVLSCFEFLLFLLCISLCPLCLRGEIHLFTAFHVPRHRPYR